MEIKQPQMPVF